jgi:two-component system, response regulator PdtaR
MARDLWERATLIRWKQISKTGNTLRATRLASSEQLWPVHPHHEVSMPTVLVVEDEVMIREVVRDELEDAGYTVVLASHADAAIAILETRRDIHLVFTDIEMPGSMDGLNLAAYVRDRWPPVHIIITTGKARPATIPANALFIQKPYVGRAVVTAMRTFENM